MANVCGLDINLEGYFKLAGYFKLSFIITEVDNLDAN